MSVADTISKQPSPEDISPRQAWLLATRPKTLPAAIAPVIVGTALAITDHTFQPLPALAALAVSLLLQIAVNLANDYFDHVKGIDTPERLGPLRVTHSGLIPPAHVKTAMALMFAAAAAIGIYLIAVGGLPVLIIGTACILSALAYSGGPYPLASHSLGDLFAFLFFGWVAVSGTYFVQARTLTPMVLLTASQVGFLITAILVINNLRDIETDKKCGKITLAVRLGGRGSKIEYGFLLIAAYIPLPLLIMSDRYSPWMLLPLLSLPPAFSLLNKVRISTGGSGLNQLLAATARMALIFSCLLAIALVVNGIIRP